MNILHFDSYLREEYGTTAHFQCAYFILVKAVFIILSPSAIEASHPGLLDSLHSLQSLPNL